MQALFYMDMQDDSSLKSLESFSDNFRPPKKAQPFFLTLVSGVLETKAEIDILIERFSKNWKIQRMPCVDRNVMRIAVYELLYCEDIPPKVSINEAVDVGKKFGTEESGAFINGIMDSIRDALENEGKLKKVVAHVNDEVS
ncbi:Transcription termination protein NusB [Olavius algarvensis Delta 1 endosymbiont]|nr:Transcription termination protein NusB [Olavius algarvensis Delta 1 endosymbiont]